MSLAPVCSPQLLPGSACVNRVHGLDHARADAQHAIVQVDARVAVGGDELHGRSDGQHACGDATKDTVLVATVVEGDAGETICIDGRSGSALEQRERGRAAQEVDGLGASINNALAARLVA